MKWFTAIALHMSHEDIIHEKKNPNKFMLQWHAITWCCTLIKQNTKEKEAVNKLVCKAKTIFTDDVDDDHGRWTDNVSLTSE